MSSLKQAAMKAEKTKEERRLEKINNHKCNGCAFSFWTGLKFYCPFSSCAKESLRR
ncbi:MAG: hypothetical protein ACM3TR_11580 [Caulobacteraceae bacterium]